MRLAAAVSSATARARLGAPVIVEPEPLVVVSRAEDLYPLASIGGGCGCGGVSCATCLPEPIVDRGGKVYAPPDWVPPAQLLSDPMLMRRAVAQGCITEIYSQEIVLPAGTPAGAATEVAIEPSQGCFILLQRKVVAISDVDPQQRQRILINREFVGDCPITCQQFPAYSDFIDTDNCEWCPTREVDIGRENDNEHYHLTAQNLNPAGDVRVIVGLRGICYPSRKCWRGWCGMPGQPGGYAAPTVPTGV